MGTMRKIRQFHRVDKAMQTDEWCLHRKSSARVPCASREGGQETSGGSKTVAAGEGAEGGTSTSEAQELREGV